MLAGRDGIARPGVTLAELLVALTLSGLVLATATSSLLRQQRTARVVGGSAAGAAQMRAATGALAAELTPLSAGAGDLAGDAASDTALQLRALVASGAACDDAVSTATFADEDDGASEALGRAAPRAGDSLWWYAGAESGWRGRVIVSSDSVSAPCMLTGTPSRPARRITVNGADSIPFGAHLRVTRPSRYSFYRSGDGSWQLGLNDWIRETGRFAPPQPVAGPFVMRAGRERGGFRFFDQSGDELSVSDLQAQITRVARIRVVVLVRRAPGAEGSDSLARDSVDIALQPADAP